MSADTIVYGVTPLEIGDSEDLVVPVHIEHLHQKPWIHPFTSNAAASDTLNGAVAVNAKVLPLNDATGFTAGDIISISLGTVHTHMYRKIISISVNDLTIDSGIDIALTDGSVIQEVDVNMAVDGSSIPVIFTVRPAPGERVDIIRILPVMTHKSQGTDDKFGSLAALINGVHLRKNFNNGEYYQTLDIWRTNSNLRCAMYDVSYSDKAGPSLFGTSARWSVFVGSGAVINLDSGNNEVLECVIQDDLTASTQELASFEICAEGHIEI